MSKKFNRKMVSMIMATSLGVTAVSAQVVPRVKNEMIENIEVQAQREATTGSMIQVVKTTDSAIQVLPVEEVEGNLIDNFSFENVTDSPLGDWQGNQFATGWEAKPHYKQPNKVTIPEIIVDTTEKVSGKNSVRLKATTATNRGYITQTIEVNPNQMYEIGAWIKAEKVNAGRFGIQIIELNEKNEALTTKPDETTPIVVDSETHDWKEYKTVITTAETTKKLQVKVFLGPGFQAQKGATAWIDNLVIKQHKQELMPVESVTLPTYMILEQETTQTLTANIEPLQASNKKVRWLSSNPEVVSVNESGEITAHQIGQAQIEVITEDGNFRATCEIEVKAADNNLLVSNGGFEFTTQAKNDGKQEVWSHGVAPKDWANIFIPSGHKGQTFELDQQVYCEGTQSIHMSSPDSMARTAFNTTITTLDPTKTYELSFKSKTEKVAGKGVYLRSQYFGKSGKLGDGPATKKITGTNDWTTYSVMFKDMPVGTTKVVIDVFLEEATGDAWIDDMQIKEAYNFKLNKEEVNLNVGGLIKLKGIFTPEDIVMDKTIKWSSSNDEIATVNKDGEVEAKGPGVAIITGMTQEGYKAECKVAVDDPALLPYYTQIREKWENRLTLNNIENKQDQVYIDDMEALSQSAQKLWNSMEKYEKSLGKDNRQELWAQYDTTKVSAQLTYTFQNLRTMAKAYASEGSSLYHNQQLKEDILDALEWTYDNRYHENFGKIYDNWYHWCIAIPQTLGDILTLMYDDLRPEQLEKELKTMDRFNPTPKIAVGIYDNVIDMTGANLLDKAVVSTLTGMLGNSSKHMYEARDAVSEVLPYVTDGDGFYKDGSFVQHESIPYAGGYGGVLMKGLSEILFMTEGTAFEVVDPQIENVYDWIINAFEPLYYKGAIMDMVSGRGIARAGQSDHTRGKGLLSRMLALSETAPMDKQLAIKSYIKENIVNDSVCKDYFKGMNINDIIAIKELLADDTIQARGDLELHKVYGAMDRVVHHRPGFTLGISMYSDRISHFEYGNGENKKGWHTASGMTYLYNDDVTQFGDDFWPTVDMMRLPGITTDHTDGSIKDWYKYYSKESWVGGSSLHDLYGATGMAFTMERSSLEGKKSWFSFDDEIVALGAGINAKDNREVETIVENRKIKESGDNLILVDGQKSVANLGDSQTIENPKWAFLEGNTGKDHIGYYFPEGGQVKVLRASRTSSWNTINNNASNDEITKNYASLAVEHGSNPVDAGYSYVLLPNKTADEVAAYSKLADITIMANTKDVQAVRENKLGVVGINFWNPSEVEYITAKNPCSVMIDEGTGTLSLGISDPTHQADEVKIVLDKADYQVVSKDDTVTVKNLGSQIEITVKTGKSVGRTHKLELVSNKPVSMTLNKEHVALRKGSSEIIKIQALPESVELGNVTWKSSDERVASVTDNGDTTATIKALKKGEAIITVTTADGKLSATCKVTVRNNDNSHNNESTVPSEKTKELQLADKVQELVDKVNNLSTSEKKEFQETVVNYMPYTSVAGEMKLSGNQLPKEVIELINQDPSLLKKIGIDTEQYIQTVTLDPIDGGVFKDVNTNHWAYESIQKVVELGIVKGYPQGTFKPNEKLTVTDTFTFLDRVLLLNGDRDMKLSRQTVEKYVTDKEHWAFNHVASVASRLTEETLQQIMQMKKGYITRELLAEVIYEIHGKPELTSSENGFKDIKDSKYQEAMIYCIEQNILQGANKDEILPHKMLTRAELMNVLARIIK